MCKGILYVGVDVGQEELWVAIEGHKPHAFSHTVNGVKRLWNWVHNINSEAILHFCMEATGVYSLQLATRLFAYPDTQISIVNPAQISSFAKAQLRRSKTDRVDALVILAFAQSQHPKSWRPEPESLQKLTNLVNQAEALRATLRQWDNRAYTQAYIPNLPKPVSKTQMLCKELLGGRLTNCRGLLRNCVKMILFSGLKFSFSVPFREWRSNLLFVC